MLSFLTAVDAPVAPETTTVRCSSSFEYKFGIFQFPDRRVNSYATVQLTFLIAVPVFIDCC